MRTKYLLLGAIFAIFGLSARAQVSDMYFQGFESGETANYSGSPSSSVRYSRTIYSGGSRALKLVQSTSENVEFILDTIDFTQNTTLRYIALRFDHICRIPANGSGDYGMGRIYYKREDQSDWIAMSSTEYNTSGGPGTYSEDFAEVYSFKENSYSEWWSLNVPSVANDQWRSERFDLDNIMTASVPTNHRKLLIKFVLKKRTLTGNLDTNNVAWWIDNIRISASAERMVTPRITMIEYPTIERYPNSRGAHIELAATTSVSSGIHPDSVYLFYTGGSDPTVHQLFLTPVTGVANHFECRIPFYGYDTLMRFYCVARDATGNANRVTFPPTDDTWVEYRCVRGETEQPCMSSAQLVGTSSSTLFPFPSDADHRCEFVYDSALLKSAGYGPGAITALRFMVASSVTANRVEQRFQIKMKNIPANYSVQMTEQYDYLFTTEAMQTVYDSVLTIPAMPSNTELTINLQDTFFYAGKDILIQMTYDGVTDHTSAINVKTIAVPTNKKTLYFWNGTAEYGYNPFTTDDFERTSNTDTKRPALVFCETHLQPLLFDAGISALVDPNYDVPMRENPDSITVRLKNYGDRTLDSVRISYNIDDAVFGYYDWPGSLVGGAEADVLIATNVSLTPGFHTLMVWVEDTVLSGGQRYRDHEPYNDTMSTEFVVCDGPMNGVRRIGGSAAHFNSIDEFLFSLSRCGVDDSLKVLLAPGSYPPFTMPVVPGISESNYIVFESMSSTRAVLYSDNTMDQGSIVNLENTSNIRFRNLNFVRNSGPLTDMVTLGIGSVNCQFINCNFTDMLTNPVTSLRISSMINSGYTNNMTVENCNFTGGGIAVNVKGEAPDGHSIGAVVRKCKFYSQYTNAVKVEYMDSVMVVGNEMYDVFSNASYILLLNGCAGTVSVERNKIYTSRGAGALAASDIVATESRHALFANNMIVSNDDGTANQLTTPLNIIQGNWIDVVYNSVKLTGPTRNNVAAATFGGSTLNNSRFMNNIIASVDNVNYAFSYQPLSSTTNTVGRNVYFSNGPVLNRRSSSTFTSMAGWLAAMPDDTLSVSLNPNFLNTSLVDLRTYNRNIKGIGIPIAGVTTDIFDTVRGDSATCPGAFEFSSLPYDFEPEALVSPLADNCYMPSSVELVVRMRNSGIRAYDSTTTAQLRLSYRLNNGSVHTVNINQTIPADDTISVHTGQMLNLPAGTFNDVTYTIKVWNAFANDPNPMNDTNVFTVISRYHPAAPADILDSIPYAASDTITPTTGINTWQVYNSTSAPRRQSQIFWYNDSTDTEPFFVGPTYITGPMQEDAQYYIRQRRAQPIVRFTQVELVRGNSAVGLTSPMPYWMENNRKLAVQLTNIGDATAYLEGDSLMIISPTASLNKTYKFGNVKIEPGQSLVVQYATFATTDSNVTIRNGITTTYAWNNPIAFLYRRNGVVEDAVPLNTVITANNTPWTSAGVPSYVWSGGALSYPNNTTAGIIRSSFNGNAGDWEFSTGNNPMFLGTTNESWVRYVDNGCEGEIGRVTIVIMAPPAVDINVDAPVLPESGCGLGAENISVLVSNFGGDTASNVVLTYCAGNDTVTDTIVGDLLPHSDTNYTFSTPLNLAFPNDSTVMVRVWAHANVDDPLHANDTSFAEVTSLFTPVAPAAIPDRTVVYATSDTVSHIPTAHVMPVWYDYNLTPVDTGYTHITDILYGNGTMGMSYLAIVPREGQVGTGVTTNGNTAFPSPYQSASKFVKQQYLYSAYDLTSAGLEQGFITAISFYLDTIVGTTNSINYLDYTITLGSTSDTIFSGTAATSWKEANTVVYQRDTLTLTQNDDHAWVTHNFTTPYEWDGVSTVVVQLTYQLTTAVTTGVKTRFTTKANTTLHKNQAAAITPTTGSLTKGGNRPNIKFMTDVYGCPSPITTYNVTLSGLPLHDATLFWADGADTLVYSSCDTIGLPMKMRNQGSLDIDTLVIYYHLDTMALDSMVVIDTFAAGHLYDLSLLNRPLSPGRHSVTAVVSVPGDTIASNDTIRSTFTVRFCEGNYTIAVDDPTADYRSFGAAIDTLNQVGVVGPVTFLVDGGIYNEQVVLNNINGSSDTNTISFIGATDSVLLRFSTNQANNYVMKIDGAANVNLQSIMMEARPTANNVNYANVLVMQNDNNIRINDCHFKVKGTLINPNASCIVLQGDVSNLTIANSVTDSGYYAFKTAGTVTNYSNIRLYDNTFRGFASGGIYIRGVNQVVLTHNEIVSGNSANNRGLIGIYMAATTDSMVIQKNFVYLVDEKPSAKRGIQLENVVGTAAMPAVVVNNMVSTQGTGSSGLTPAKSAGIWIDSLSAYVNVLYNSVRVRGNNVTSASTTAILNTANDASYSFWCGSTPSQIIVMNNILSNFGFGYAYYVSQVNTVTTSNYNAYYTEAAKKFAWGSVPNIASLSDLQTNNSDDGNSVYEEPFFSASNDLHLTMTNFAAKAQYNTDVIEDIDGTTRPPIPGPTIGAHEKYRMNHDMSVVRIYKPVFPLDTLQPTNVETDSVLVVATFNNNGLSNESGVQWYAYIENYETTTRSVTRNLGSFTPSQMKRDSVMVPTYLGMIGTQRIHVVVIAANDQAPADNEISENFYLAPAFNLAAVKMSTTSSVTPQGCDMSATQININVKNEGSKPFPVGAVIKIGYSTKITNPSTLNITTLTEIYEQNVTLTTPLPPGSDTWFTFDSLANLYPTDNFINIKVKVSGWVNYVFDITPKNDTTASNSTASPVVDSYYRPARPQGTDVYLPYGTWGEVTAEQQNNRAIRWYRDSTAAPFFPLNADGSVNNNYNISRRWNRTPQYFHDSTYYLMSLSDKGCPSYFDSVTVHVQPRKTRDIAVERMLAPLGGRVYMENDTVRVQIANYGTSAQSGFPITYQLKRGNNILQTVVDTVSATIEPDQTYAFTFDSLLTIPTPTDSQAYSLMVWTDLTNDATRRNDTLRYAHTFVSLPVARYNRNVNFPSAEDTRFDISRVTYNGIDLDLPPLNRSYTDMGEYPNPDYPVLHVTRGTSDSIIIEIAPLDATEQHFRCRGSVHIDFNRDGYFTSGGACNEQLIGSVPFYSDSVLASVITIPPCASLGYMKMRVKVVGYTSESNEGHVIDFLLFVDDEAPAQDLAITQIVSPRSPLIRDNNSKIIRFRMANRGSNTINNVDIHYQFLGDTVDPTAAGVLPWTGSLAPGQSTVVALPAHLFPVGTSTLSIWHNLDEDADTTNNRLIYEYHRFRVLRPVLSDNFDNVNLWYAPKGRNVYSRNWWERGMPNKSRLDTTNSGCCAWVTSLNSTVVTGKRGNVSYLYSPIINISQVRPDTISFYLRRNLTGGSFLRIEYLNYENKWMNLMYDSLPDWYNDMENYVFNGSSATGEGYTRYFFSATSTRITTDFLENMQFRLVYTTPMGTSATSSYGEGCAVDDFVVGRARRAIDAGVVAITQPEAPKYGQTLYPEVVVKNYGYDTLRSIRIGYTHYGTYLAKYTNITCLIPPDSLDTFQCSSPFIVTSDYPEEFHITAFTTRSDDIYRNNDTLTQLFHLRPLDNDISAECFLSPLDHVVAGDTSVKVTMRIRNFGLNPVTEATATYIINGVTRVDEQINFNDVLGRPLDSLEYFNYTFHHRITAPMGLMNITGIIKSPNNDYIYNDTITKRTEGIVAITDIAASSVIVDTSDHNLVRIGLVIDNVGARGVNNFEVGYWIDHDTTTMVRETYSRYNPLPALNTGYYLFTHTLPWRSSGYNIVSGFVHVNGDNDPSNDTTDIFSEQYVDIEVLKVLVEENANNDCRVFLELQNVGNLAVIGQQLRLRAAINGSDSNITNIQRRVDPGEIIHIELNRRIPKSPIRQYVGSGWIRPVSGDNNRMNDQTSVVEVINYFEGVPTVNGNQLVLEQNYPNPFSQQTNIPFTLPESAKVRFFVMDAMGHIVHRAESFYQAGSHLITIDMDAYAAGVYYYGIEVNGQRQMRKMILR